MKKIFILYLGLILSSCGYGSLSDEFYKDRVFYVDPPSIIDLKKSIMKGFRSLYYTFRIIFNTPELSDSIREIGHFYGFKNGEDGVFFCRPENIDIKITEAQKKELLEKIQDVKNSLFTSPIIFFTSEEFEGIANFKGIANFRKSFIVIVKIIRLFQSSMNSKEIMKEKYSKSKNGIFIEGLYKDIYPFFSDFIKEIKDIPKTSNCRLFLEYLYIRFNAIKNVLKAEKDFFEDISRTDNSSTRESKAVPPNKRFLGLDLEGKAIEGDPDRKFTKCCNIYGISEGELRGKKITSEMKEKMKKEIRKTYGGLSRIYHPDKRRRLELSGDADALAKLRKLEANRIDPTNVFIGVDEAKYFLCEYIDKLEEEKLSKGNYEEENFNDIFLFLKKVEEDSENIYQLQKESGEISLGKYESYDSSESDDRYKMTSATNLQKILLESFPFITKIYEGIINGNERHISSIVEKYGTYEKFKNEIIPEINEHLNKIFGELVEDIKKL